MLDDYGYSWEKRGNHLRYVNLYQSHLGEALEVPQQLFRRFCPYFQIICEINRRYCDELWRAYPGNNSKVAENAILEHGEIKMATLCLVAAQTINGVSELHSEILKNDIFKDYYEQHPQKFTNVTNGITHRRWLHSTRPY